MNNLDFKVSFFTNIKNTTSGIMTPLSTILHNIQNGEWKYQVETLRSEPNEQKQKLLKKNLPNFTASGLFESRKSTDLIQHSDVIILDFDGIDDPRALQNRIKGDPLHHFSFISVRGKGLAVGVKINGDKHLESFNGLEKHFLEKYDQQVDKACKDVARTRFISYDEGLLITEDSLTYEVIPAQVPPIVAAPVVTSDIEKYNWCKGEVDKRMTYTDGGKHEYLFSLAGFLNKVGVAQTYALSQMVSDFESPSKDRSAITSIVNHCYKFTNDFGTITYTPNLIKLPDGANEQDVKALYRVVFQQLREGTPWTEADVAFQSEKCKLPEDIVRNIYHHIYETNQDELGIKKKPMIAQVESFIRKNYELRRNVITQNIEYRPKGMEFTTMNEDTINRALKHAGLSYPLNQLGSLLRSDFIPDCDPIKDWFEGLQPWDGVTDHIQELASHVVAENQEFFNTQFKKMLVRSIACTIFRKVNRTVFVLVSEKQEIGKSSFVRFLSPLGDEYYTEAPLRGDKDSEFRLSENMLYNLEELSSLNNLEVNQLKAIISKGQVKERKPYGKQEITAPRRCNFFGSTNKEEFLTDTVNTRWLCFTIDDIDWSYSDNIDVKKVWAQAWALYNQGFKCQLTKEEQALREEINKGHEVRSDESHLILRFFKPVKSTDVLAEFMNTTEIAEFIQRQLDYPAKLHPIAIGRAMSQFDFVKSKKKINGVQYRGYWVGIIARGETTDVAHGNAPLFEL